MPREVIPVTIAGIKLTGPDVASPSLIPTALADGATLPAGSTYDAQDTGNWWMWDGVRWNFQGARDAKLSDIVAAVNRLSQALSVQLASEFTALKRTILTQTFVETTELTQ